MAIGATQYTQFHKNLGLYTVHIISQEPVAIHNTQNFTRTSGYRGTQYTYIYKKGAKGVHSTHNFKRRGNIGDTQYT